MAVMNGIIRVSSQLAYVKLNARIFTTLCKKYLDGSDRKIRLLCHVDTTRRVPSKPKATADRRAKR